MPYHGRAPQKSHTQGYRSSPYGASPRNNAGRGKGPGSFDVQREYINEHSPDAESARRNPLHSYFIQTGKHRGNTLAHISRFDEQYLGWISSECCRNLPRDHIIRRAIDQWNAERRASGALPPVSSAPSRFKSGKYHLYMQEKYLRKWWKVTAQELVDAGVDYKVNEKSKTQAKKFSPYQVYEYVKKHNKLDREELEAVVEDEKDRINRARATYKSYQNGDFAGGGIDYDDCPWW
ncbi:hypothetical protein J4E90_002615 [Alternaria incomplexa]|uniref:uncharacterized protein n=1 Tax=Alternaria incomplexa TaxID=1187928 RepID=UPI00221F44E0|nr:uncharacterized protein J4E90_002615 [Alternaria incomplexa]KAI4918234.1 hypothetical protein J4E90_002615 [Alternaria incomplexa]